MMKKLSPRRRRRERSESTNDKKKGQESDAQGAERIQIKPVTLSSILVRSQHSPAPQQQGKQNVQRPPPPPVMLVHVSPPSEDFPDDEHSELSMPSMLSMPGTAAGGRVGEAPRLATDNRAEGHAARSGDRLTACLEPILETDKSDKSSNDASEILVASDDTKGVTKVSRTRSNLSARSMEEESKLLDELVSRTNSLATSRGLPNEGDIFGEDGVDSELDEVRRRLIFASSGTAPDLETALTTSTATTGTVETESTDSLDGVGDADIAPFALDDMFCSSPDVPSFLDIGHEEESELIERHVSSISWGKGGATRSRASVSPQDRVQPSGSFDIYGYDVKRPDMFGLSVEGTKFNAAKGIIHDNVKCAGMRSEQERTDGQDKEGKAARRYYDFLSALGDLMGVKTPNVDRCCSSRGLD